MRKVITLILVAVAFCSCRVNNGDIGDFFGSWLLYSMTVDGQEADGFDQESTFWEFQNNIILISQVDDLFEKNERWGTWVDEGNRLLLNFTHSENGIAPGTGPYRAPEWLYFPENEIIGLTFTERTSKQMALSWQDQSGHTIVYSLRKIW